MIMLRSVVYTLLSGIIPFVYASAAPNKAESYMREVEYYQKKGRQLSLRSRILSKGSQELRKRTAVLYQKGTRLSKRGCVLF